MADSVSGKLYSDICNKLKVNNKNAIILTDVFMDKSVDKSYPIITLVISQKDGAEVWEKVVDYFVKRKNPTIYKAGNIIKKQPTDIINGKVYEYKTDEDFTLYRHKDYEDCFFINGVPKNLIND